MDKITGRRIITFEPNFFKFISTDVEYKLLQDKNHYPIIRILSKGPLTVRELQTEYEKLTGNEKSDKTIYRYIKNLVDVGLLTNCGQLFIPGKTATENLFSRTAHFFYMRSFKDKIIDSEHGEKIIETIGKMLLQLFPGKKKYSSECIKSLILKLSKSNEIHLENSIESKEDQLISDLSNFNLDEIEFIFKQVILISSLFSSSEIINSINQCFS